MTPGVFAAITASSLALASAGHHDARLFAAGEADLDAGSNALAIKRLLPDRSQSKRCCGQRSDGEWLCAIGM
jgi:hypothetical protein